MNTTEAILKTRQLLCDAQDRDIAEASAGIEHLQGFITDCQETKELIQTGALDHTSSFLQLLARNIS